LLGFYGAQLLLQFSYFGFMPLGFLGCFGLLLNRQKILLGFRQLFSLFPQFGQLGLVRYFGRGRSSVLVWPKLSSILDSGSSSPWVSKLDGFNSSSRDNEAPLLELTVVLFFLVDILGFQLEPNTNGGRQLL
jgi:hypothetical protein